MPSSTARSSAWTSRGALSSTRLFFRRAEPSFLAFDLLWLNGEDLRDLSVVDRKEALGELVLTGSSFMGCVDHVDADGEKLFDICCEMNLEGIVAKRKTGLYRPSTEWLKIKNPDYSQAEGRQELFRSRR